MRPTFLREGRTLDLHFPLDEECELRTRPTRCITGIFSGLKLHNVFVNGLAQAADCLVVAPIRLVELATPAVADVQPQPGNFVGPQALSLRQHSPRPVDLAYPGIVVAALRPNLRVI